MLFVRLWARWALAAIAGLPLAFLLAGQFVFPNSKRALQVWMSPEIIDDLGEVSLRLSGKVLPFGYFKRWHEFNIEVNNLWLLLVIALLSLGGIAGALTLDDVPMPGGSLYYGISVWLLVCYLSWRWIWERRAMRSSGIALGNFRVTRTEGPLMKCVVYHFKDQMGEYRGGFLKSLFCDTRDDLTIVFYDESDPEVSVPASAMMFHKLKWAELL